MKKVFLAALALAVACGGQSALAQATSRTESVTKRAGPGPNEKVKSEVVVGVVKKYKAGEKITVEGPKGEDFSFDLDEQVTVKGNVAVGQKVRVEYTMMEDGTERVLILSAEPAKAAGKS